MGNVGQGVTVSGKAGDTTSRYLISPLEPDGVDCGSALYYQWEELAENSTNLYAFYQSPAWWDYSLHGTLRDYVLRLHEAERPVLVSLNAADGSLVGAVGVSRSPCPLLFEFHSHTLTGLHVRAIKVMGGQPLVRNEEDLYVDLVRWLFAAFPDRDCIYMQSIPVGGYCWNVLCESQTLRKYAKVYIPGEGVLLPRITLPESFKQYLQKFKSSTRYNLQRRVRRLCEHGGGQLELIRIEDARQVKEFLDEAAAISAKSWQCKALGQRMNNSPDECRWFAQFAENETLRCYLLRCGGSPCAFVRGFQYGNVFYYSRIGFDEQLARFSPGTVLLYLLIEDLFNHRPPRYVNFQEGYWDYKRLFATDYVEIMKVLIVRKGARLSSHLLVGTHRAYRSSVSMVKRLIGWKRGLGEDGRPEKRSNRRWHTRPTLRWNGTRDT